ncbi:Hsp20/alpha crystallin family protein [Amycolatopsis regifaucium]|uniref:Heat-shock protein Hsp20 n=1 Tax=Amycolatopsis regifaucium TaxID=546365 RepID=A0A154MIP3_9PSEU|nr:Hsp20/alpha crystallin family protein [Amycolatopsis regifaucium]KZB84314.1 heat-shock protein Hsp20 [Amycolatopsis regifaucium]OKA03293.1 heat-shock protein Hsp20 [Amycolatopsis regifaucium]SFJ69574.1 HSP20 family protein [Amycolatopsis regifaucium]
MLVRTDPFQALDRLAQQFFGPASRSAAMPLDAYRDGDRFVVHFDLPGVSPESIDIDVQNDVLTVKAERTAVTGDDVQTLISERPAGAFSRQLFLGDTLDADHIEAGYDAGVLTLRIPVAEQAKPRKIAVTSGGERQAIKA